MKKELRSRSYCIGNIYWYVYGSGEEMNIEALKIVLQLLGGLALFIYGMNFMSEGLQKAAGEKMKSILALLTRNVFVGILAGRCV